MRETLNFRRRDREGDMLILPSLCRVMMKGASKFISSVGGGGV